MGNNNGNSAADSTSMPTSVIEPTTFKVKVVEHLSWETYDKDSQTFKPGHEDNKPIAKRKFIIRINGKEQPIETDDNGVIELKDQNKDAKFELIFEPENAALNNKYVLFYNRIALVDH